MDQCQEVRQEAANVLPYEGDQARQLDKDLIPQGLISVCHDLEENGKDLHSEVAGNGSAGEDLCPVQVSVRHDLEQHGKHNLGLKAMGTNRSFFSEELLLIILS